MRSTLVLALVLTPSAVAASESFALSLDARGLNRDATGTLTAAGPEYAASFHTDRVRFHPALATSPRTEALDFELSSVTVGDSTLAVSRGVAPQHADLTAQYDRGAFVERYDVLATGLEQSFVFAALPERGDLVVHGRLTTDLPLVFADPVGGLRFEGEHGGLFVGGVTGIDANGVEATGWIELDGNRLELGLPAEFVETAALPLVLDPLIGAILGLNTALTDDKDPDVAQYGDTNLVVWEHELSIITSHIRARQHDLAGNALTAIQTVAGSGLNRNAAVGVLADAKPKFVIAWEYETGGDTFIRATFFGVQFQGLVPAIDLSNTGTDVTPDVGYGQTETTVVWAEKNGIRACNVLDDGSGGVKDAGVENVTNTQQDSEPAISQSAASPNWNMVAWRHDAGAVNAIQARRWETTSPSAQWPAQQLVTSGLGYMGQPDVSSSHEDDHFIVWEEEESGASTRDVLGRRMYFTGTNVSVNLVTTIEADANDDEYAPAVCYATNQYTVAFLDGSGGGNQFLDARSLDAATFAHLEGNLTVGGPVPFGDPAVACQSASSDDPSDLSFVAWSESAGAHDDLMGRRIEGIGGTHTPLLGTGCGFFSGEARISAPKGGNPAMRHELWYGEPGAPAYIMVGAPAIHVPWGAGGTIVPFPTVIQFIGLADFDGYLAFETPVAPGLAGLTVWEQWLVFSAGGSCDPSGWSLSDATEITFE